MFARVFRINRVLMSTDWDRSWGLRESSIDATVKTSRGAFWWALFSYTVFPIGTLYETWVTMSFLNVHCIQRQATCSPPSYDLEFQVLRYVAWEGGNRCFWGFASPVRKIADAPSSAKNKWRPCQEFAKCFSRISRNLTSKITAASRKWKNRAMALKSNDEFDPRFDIFHYVTKHLKPTNNHIYIRIFTAPFHQILTIIHWPA